MDSQTGELVGGPDVVNRGFVHEETSGDILEEARSAGDAVGEGIRGSPRHRPLRAPAERPPVLKRYFNEVTQRKPVILPVIMEV